MTMILKNMKNIGVHPMFLTKDNNRGKISKTGSMIV